MLINGASLHVVHMGTIIFPFSSKVKSMLIKHFCSCENIYIYICRTAKYPDFVRSFGFFKRYKSTQTDPTT